MAPYAEALNNRAIVRTIATFSIRHLIGSHNNSKRQLALGKLGNFVGFTSSLASLLCWPISPSWPELFRKRIRRLELRPCSDALGKQAMYGSYTDLNW